MKQKKILSLVLVFFMIFSSIPFTSMEVKASASTRTIALDFTGADVTNTSGASLGKNPQAADITDVSDSEKWAWYYNGDGQGHAGKVLVLDGFNLSCNDKPDALKVPGGTTIVLKNSNSITNTMVYTDTYSNGIYSDGALIITGSGVLTVEVINGSSNGSNNANGIFAMNGTITINGGAIIETAANTRGISTDYGGDILVSGANTSLTATGRNTYSTGIRTDESGSLLSVTDGAAVIASGTYCGIYTKDLTADATSNVTATGNGSYGAFGDLNGTITLTGVAVKAGANAGSATIVEGNRSNLTNTSNKYVNITVAEASVTKKAIDAWILTANNGGPLTGLTVTDTDANTVTVTGTAIETATAALTLAIPAGVTVDWQATMSGSADKVIHLTGTNNTGIFMVSAGAITSTSTAKTAAYGNAVIWNENVTAVNITGGTVTGGAGSGNYSYGIYNNSTGAVTISGAAKVNGGSSSTESHGIFNNVAGGSITISDTAEVNGGTGGITKGICMAYGSLFATGGKIISIKGAGVHFSSSSDNSGTFSGSALVFGKPAFGGSKNIVPTYSNDAIAISWDGLASTYTKDSSTGLTVTAAAGATTTAKWDSSSGAGVTYTRGGSDTTGFIAVPDVTVGTPTITGVSAGTATIAASGGTSLITVAGTHLADGMKVTAFDSGGTATAITGTTTGSGTSQTVTLTFPANASTSDAKAYTIKASTDSGSTWSGQTATVTVSQAPSQEAVTLYFRNDSTNGWNLYTDKTAGSTNVYTGNGGGGDGAGNKWKVEEATLKLKDGFFLNTSTGVGLDMATNTILDVTGTATIMSTVQSGSNTTTGIKASNGEITIQGSGMLNVSCVGATASTGRITGIDSYVVTTMKGSVTVSSSTLGTTTSANNTAVSVSGKLTMEDSAKLYATAGTASDSMSYSYGVDIAASGSAGDVVMSGTSIIVAIAGTAMANRSIGVHIAKGLNSTIASTASLNGTGNDFAFGVTSAATIKPGGLKPVYDTLTIGDWIGTVITNKQFSTLSDGTTALKSGKLVSVGNTVTLAIKKDGTVYNSHGKTFNLYEGGTSKYTGQGTTGTVSFPGVENGTYDIYDGTTDTGVDVTVNNAAATANLNYYTVKFAVANASLASGSTISATYNGSPVSTTNVVLGGKTLVITAVGAGTDTYTYAWTGTGTNGETTASLTINNLAAAVNATCTATGKEFPNYTLFVQENDNKIYMTNVEGGEATDLTGITWDGTKKILTLSNFNFTTKVASPGFALKLPDGATINANGTSTIKANSGNGISARDLKITSDDASVLNVKSAMYTFVNTPVIEGTYQWRGSVNADDIDGEGVWSNPPLVSSGNKGVAIKFSKPADPTPSGSGSYSDGGSTPDSSVMVDGKLVDAGKVETRNNETMVTVNQTVLDKQIETAHDNVTIVVPTTNAGTATAQLVVKNVEDMAQKDMTLNVKVGLVEYDLPTAAIDTTAVLTALGATNSADVVFNISITSKVDTATASKVEGALKAAGINVFLPAVEFKVTAVYNGQTVEIDTFDSYVARVIQLTADQAKKITTAVVVEANGKLRHVPTKIYQENGEWYGKINSKTNSAYVLIYRGTNFTDIKGKSYEAMAKEMSGRKIMTGFSTKGVKTFGGEKKITNSGLALVLVRALGLPENGDYSVFKKANSKTLYAGALGTAYEYGIITKAEAAKFVPGAKISRQDAMVMIARAAKVANYKGKSVSVAAYTDASLVKKENLSAVKFCVGSGLDKGSKGKLRPNDYITRAEAGSMIFKLLQKAKLV